MPQSFSELKNLLRAGAGVSISANDYAAYDLIRLAGVAHEGNAKLMITDSLFLEKDKVALILEEGKNSVILDRDTTRPGVIVSEDEDEEYEDGDELDLDDEEIE